MCTIIYLFERLNFYQECYRKVAWSEPLFAIVLLYFRDFEPWFLEFITFTHIGRTNCLKFIYLTLHFKTKQSGISLTRYAKMLFYIVGQQTSTGHQDFRMFMFLNNTRKFQLESIGEALQCLTVAFKHRNSVSFSQVEPSNFN